MSGTAQMMGTQMFKEIFRSQEPKIHYHLLKPNNGHYPHAAKLINL